MHDRPDAPEQPSAAAAERRPDAQPFTIVGIGASAGGLEALSVLVSGFEYDHAAFVVVQHLAPQHESHLTQILASSTKMTVSTITNGVKMERNHIYVAPPNADVAVHRGHLQLIPPVAGRVVRPSIDSFLRSLAADRGEFAIGVLLSGAGTDGTLGLKAIKAEGGITFVQDPSTARHDGMPRAALDSGSADFCLPPAALADELMRVCAYPYLGPTKGSLSQGDQNDLDKIFILIRKESGTDLTHYKRSTIERRVERRMALQKIDRVGDYVRYLQANPREVGILYKDILIGVTEFFRDRAPFEALKLDIFPRILAGKRPGDGIRLWCAGCSTGEEAYSLAMCLLEFLGDRAADYKVQVFGTDLDNDSIQSARRGVYPSNIALDVSPERLHRFFWKTDAEFQITRTVRDILVFATQNLTKDAPFSHVDLVSCRNVLIYMQPVLQKKVLRILHYALKPSGCLLLGTSETVGDASDLFSFVDRKNKIYAKKNITSMATFDFSSGVAGDAAPHTVFAAPRTPRTVATVQQLADRKLLDRYVPPGVLVNESFDIIQYRGRTGPYLEPTPGAATLNLLKNVRAELIPELRAALQRARTENIPVTCGPIRLSDGDGDEPRQVLADVVPIHEVGTKSGCFMVVFKERERSFFAQGQGQGIGQEIDGQHGLPATAGPPEGGGDQRAQELERELLITKDYLQSTIEEVETSNEDLKSSNEELQSANEELQSTNEELETSKEELQSSNEELTTVNDELQNRMSELSQSNDDLFNVMAAISVPVVIIGLDLRIRRFSAAAESVLNLVASDLGRNIGHLGSVLKVPKVERLFREVVDRLTPVEEEVVVGERWYTMRMVPYLTSDRSIRGVVVMLVDVNPKKHGLDRALAVAEYASKLLVAIQHPLLIVDEGMRVIWANGAFHETFRVAPADTLGRLLADVGANKGKGTHGRLVGLVTATLTAGMPFKDVVVDYDVPDRGIRTVKLSGKMIAAPPGGIEQKLVLVAVEVLADLGHAVEER